MNEIGAAGLIVGSTLFMNAAFMKLRADEKDLPEPQYRYLSVMILEVIAALMVWGAIRLIILEIHG